MKDYFELLEYLLQLKSSEVDSLKMSDTKIYCLKYQFDIL